MAVFSYQPSTLKHGCADHPELRAVDFMCSTSPCGFINCVSITVNIIAILLAIIGIITILIESQHGFPETSGHAVAVRLEPAEALCKYQGIWGPS